MTRFESSEDGIKSTTSKIDDIEGVLVEEVLSEPEREKEIPHGDVTIEEVPEEGEIYSPNFVHILAYFANLRTCINNISKIGEIFSIKLEIGIRATATFLMVCGIF